MSSRNGEVFISLRQGAEGLCFHFTAGVSTAGKSQRATLGCSVIGIPAEALSMSLRWNLPIHVLLCRFGKARIFVDGIELHVKRYTFLQQV